MCGLRAGLTSNPGRAEPVINKNVATYCDICLENLFFCETCRRHVAPQRNCRESFTTFEKLLRKLGQKREKLQINLDVGDTNYRDFRQTVEREACTRDPITQSTCMTENKKKNEISQRQVVTYRDICLQIIIKMSCRVVTFAYQNSI